VIDQPEATRPERCACGGTLTYSTDRDLTFSLCGTCKTKTIVAGLPQPQLQLCGVGDVNAAYYTWGSTCGPAALAAALGLQLSDVRAAVSPGGSFKGYMGVADLKDAIPRAGGRIVRTWSRPEKSTLEQTDGAPILVLLRFLGPWDEIPNERVRARVQATYRHLICYRHGYFGPLTHYGQRANGPGWVFDVNSDWKPMRVWARRVVPELVPKRGTGEWSIDWMAQVERPRN
jgi:hypothetical protein